MLQVRGEEGGTERQTVYRKDCSQKREAETSKRDREEKEKNKLHKYRKRMMS